MKVEILSRNLIAPSSPTPPHLQKSPLSFSEQIAPSFYVPRIFFYPAEADQEHGHVKINEERSKQLRKSLSESLTIFYPLAGRYIKDDTSIHCNDKGAEYLEVQVNNRLSEILERVDQSEIELLNQLVQIPSESDDTPLVTVQFNMFECGGLAIGVGVPHRILDAFSAFAFINAFATACRIGVEKVEYRPNFQMGSIFPARDITPPQQILKADHQVLVKRFVFNGPTISKLKEAVVNAGNICGSDELLKRPPTRVEVVVALIWNALMKVSKARHGYLRPSISRFAVNLRKRTSLPIPEDCFGNLVADANAKFSPNGDQTSSNVQIHDLVGRIRQELKTTITGIASASNADDLAFILCNDVKESNEAKVNNELDVFVFTSWCRFPMYEADFGWGRPDWVSIARIPVKNFTKLMDTKDGDGIEAWIGLEEKNMLLFEQDPDIVTFSGHEKQL